jgi:hypothetical protein
MDDMGREPHAECVMVSASIYNDNQYESPMPYRRTAAALSLLFTNVAYPTPFPMVTPIIQSCISGTMGPCSQQVHYASTGTKFVDIPPNRLNLTDRRGTLELVTVGIHCDLGRAGGPYSACTFMTDGHAPALTSKCSLVSYGSWELTSNSTCSTQTSWGVHGGAAPGAECVVFAQGGTVNLYTAQTVYGNLSAYQIANSGNSYCTKPLPPNVRCTVNLPEEINHGAISPMEQNTASIRGALNCGISPRVEFVGGEKLTLGDGVTTVLSSDTSVRGVITLTSSITTNGAAAGAYQGSTVLVVSPQ